MSQHHHEVFEAIRDEYEDVVAALQKASGGKKRGTPGRPAYNPERLPTAIVTAGDAYALLLIATAEAFLREYLSNMGVAIRQEQTLSTLINQSAKELNGRSPGTPIRSVEKELMHSLRVNRNAYAHGHGRSVFPSVARVVSIVSRFLSPFP